MRRITSRRNPLVQMARDLARPRRAGETRLLLDGAHLAEDAVASGLSVLVVAVTDDLLATAAGMRLADVAAAAGAETVAMPASVLEAMSPSRTSSGVVAIAEARPATLDQAFDGPCPFVLAAIGVQDPGNLGAIVRAADAAGASAVVVLEGSADPLGWKSLRGSMGSAFRVPLVPRVAARDLLAACRSRTVRMWATGPRGGTSLFDADLRGPCCVLLGNEGGGLDRDLSSQADGHLTIPMRPGVESLNVAIAAALASYEAARQRDRNGRRWRSDPPSSPRRPGRARA